MQKFLALLPLSLALILLPIKAQADSPSVVEQPPTSTVSIVDILAKVNAKEGIMYSISQGRGLNFLATPIVEKWGVSLDAGLVSTDGLGLAVDYNLSALPVEDVPVLKFVKYLNVGFGVCYRHITLTGDLTENPKADNRFGYGPTIFMKWNF